MNKTPELKLFVAACIELAQAALEGKHTLDDFRNRWAVEADQDRLLWRMLHEVEHYLIDANIRARDPNYEQYQRNLVKELIHDVCVKYDIKR